MIDSSVATSIAHAESRGRRLACARGCAACCRSHADIPVYPLELMGLYWFVLERLQGRLRTQVAQQLAHWRTLPGCPFLVDEACAVHPVRPMACRLFNVFDRACAEGEDAFHTRPGDVLVPEQAAKREALLLLLAGQGVADEVTREELVTTGAVHRLAQNLRALPWENLAARMRDSELRQAAAHAQKGEDER
ncbi:YkgJ family cysteine cluster protein [Thiobacter aerophilum]|uniref:YkgJ family cysteine cluster protein n=1 Tax=Thiobacter aerophilum TaxID=3121275 RepID=A0ABV0EH05_9BURK